MQSLQERISALLPTILKTEQEAASDLPVVCLEPFNSIWDFNRFNFTDFD